MEGCWWQPCSLASLTQSFRGVVPVSKGHLALSDSTPSATVLSLCFIDLTKALTKAASSLWRCQRHGTWFLVGAAPHLSNISFSFFHFLLFLLCCISTPFLFSVSDCSNPPHSQLSRGLFHNFLHCFASL